MNRTRRHGARAPRLECLENRTLLDAAAGSIAFPGVGPVTVDPTQVNASRIIVQYRPLVDAAPAPAGSLDHPFTVDRGVGDLPVAPGQTVAAAIASAQADPSILYAEPDYAIQAESIPNDPGFAQQWDMQNNGQAGGVAGSDISATGAWSLTTGLSSTIVAVIDTGVDYNHPDLAANMWTNTGEIPGNGIDDDHDGYVDDVHGYDFANNDGNPMDDNGHGTHVAGTIGAVGNNGVGVAGVAWNVQIMALKFMNSAGQGYVSNAIRALNYAVAHGATISNNSWSIGSTYSAALDNAIRQAAAKGHIFVAAAGNNGRNSDVQPDFPSSFKDANIISVGASDSADRLASFSNYGATSVDLLAPGVSITSTTRGGGYGTMSGTSMAAPHVAGAAALIESMHPDWGYQQVIDAILGSVDPVASAAGKTVTGGRLDVLKAVAPAGYLDAPTVTIGAVATPQPAAIGSLTIAFSKPVSGFDLSDLSLARDGGTNLLTAGQSLTTTDGQTYTLGNLGAISAPAGKYTLSLTAAGSGISDSLGNALAADASQSWTVNPPLQATASMLDGPAAGIVDRVTVSFNGAVLDGSFTLDDVAALTGPGRAIAPTGVAKVDATTYQVLFAAQNAPGMYGLTIGPNILDSTGRAMDQDGDGIAGEAIDDRYSVALSLGMAGTASVDEPVAPVVIVPPLDLPAPAVYPKGVALPGAWWRGA